MADSILSCGKLVGRFLGHGHFMSGQSCISGFRQIVRPYSKIFGAYGAAHDIALIPFSGEEQPGDHKDSYEQENKGKGTLSLMSASCYFPHPDKEKTGGEDAHCICAKEQVFGLADGVGGWANAGVDAGEYAGQLMSNSVVVIGKERMKSIIPAKVLEKAHSLTNVRGSSTACNNCTFQ